MLLSLNAIYSPDHSDVNLHMGNLGSGHTGAYAPPYLLAKEPNHRALLVNLQLTVQAVCRVRKRAVS